MKKTFYIFSAIVTVLLFANNAAGPIVRQQKGYTGAPGDQANTCATCHNSGTFGASAKLEVFDSLGTTLVTKYALGRQYIVRMTISVTSGTPSASVQLASPISSGINDLADNIKIQLSPNPTPSTVAVSLDSKIAKTVKIQVTDIMARTVLSENWAINVGQNVRSLDMQSFAKGAYMVQIIENQNIVSKKILKI